MTATRAPSSALTSLVVGSRYLPVYLALVLLAIVASIWAPAALGGVALSAIAPFGALLGITALGQMLVIMTGGIDLSVPGTLTLGAILMVGVGDQSDERIGVALMTAVGAAVVIGLVNGILIGGLKLNALIVTLAVGQVVIGVVNRYDFPVQAQVPPGLSEWTATKIWGVSPIFWIGLGLTIAVMLALRYTTMGRKFQVVGANPVSARVVGVRVNLYQVSAYVVAAVFYALAGAALAGLLRTPGVNIGVPYLLGPIAAVVIGGASLTGGLASPLSTFAAAFFLTGLNQMMRTMGLPTSLQFVVFGLVIIGGMLVSGDRIIKGVEQRAPRAAISETHRIRKDRDLNEHKWLRKEFGNPDESTPRNEPSRGRNARWRRNMKRTKIIGLLAVLVLVVAACTSDSGDTTTSAAEEPATTAAEAPSTTAGETPSTTAASAENPLAEYDEDPSAADPALVTKALGDVEPSDADSWNIVLASIARATQDLDQATIDKAIECWNAQECETGTGGELIMGYADGGGDEVNVWRAVSHMEAILQALTYPEIGTIVSTEANFEGDPAVNDIRFLIDRGVSFIVGYPDWGALSEPGAVGGPRSRHPLRLVLRGLGRTS